MTWHRFWCGAVGFNIATFIFNVLEVDAIGLLASALGLGIAIFCAWHSYDG